MEQKRKIIFTVTNDLTYDQRMDRICTSLSEAGYDITLIGRKLKNSKALSSKKYKQKRVSCFFNKKFYFYAEYNLRLFFILLFSKADIISSVDLDTIVAGILSAKIRGRKLVFDAHEYFIEVPEVVNRKKVRKIWAWIEKTFVPKADLCYTVGGMLAENFSERLNKEFHVIVNAPRTKNQSIEEKITIPENKFILYQGALNKARGIENMILAMRNLDIEFHIIGEGDLSVELRKLVSDNNLDNKVKFLGFMEPNKLREYSSKAYLGLNVSENIGLSYYYSLNNKFFDYIHAHIPSIINNFPEYIELNNKYNIGIFAESNPEDLAEKIADLISNPNKYIELKENCIKASKELTWEKEEVKLTAIYDKIQL